MVSQSLWGSQQFLCLAFRNRLAGWYRKYLYFIRGSVVEGASVPAPLAGQLEDLRQPSAHIGGGNHLNLSAKRPDAVFDHERRAGLRQLATPTKAAWHQTAPKITSDAAIKGGL
jgi:hypothetical protein